MDNIAISLTVEQILYLILGIGIVGYNYKTYANNVSRLKDLDRRLMKIEMSYVPPDQIMNMMKSMLAEITAISMNQSVSSGPASISKMKVNDILSRALLFEERMNLEELKTMAFAFELNGGINYSSKSSAARDVLTAMKDRGKIWDVAKYIQEYRPDIFADTDIRI